MLGLIPRDSWEYSLADLVRGVGSSLHSGAEQRGIDLPGVGNCIPVRSGRAGIYASLKALALPEGSGIGVPLYCCSVVFKAIISAGHKPVFIDVDKETFCMSATDVARKSRGIEALIAVHMFGNSCDITELAAAAPSKPILEDCAQGLGCKLNGKTAGTLGTIGVFSFRSGKYLAVGEGGALHTKDAKLAGRLSEMLHLAQPIGRIGELKHTNSTFVRSKLRSQPLYGLLGHALWSKVNRNSKFDSSSRITLNPIYRSDAMLVNRRIGQLDSVIARQRLIAERYSKALEFDREMVCREPKGRFYNRLQYPVTFQTMAERDQYSNFLLSRKVDSVKYLDEIVAVTKDHFGYSGDCPVAEGLSKRVLILPNQASLSEAQVEHVGNSLTIGRKKFSQNNPCMAPANQARKHPVPAVPG